ncbi:lipase family protein [Hymenobacter jeollabukensis]|uniref:Lipase family protein n=1 Tax=Hymenobacter jeollabukensis TaxID=2025313 RepID=A0A5R8WL41_9BACT|nr:lipase family protein [Hymenobacter jeollabukensis]TLM89466.1 lipase family protein [Hymenobacter jeollabukensis]
MATSPAFPASALSSAAPQITPPNPMLPPAAIFCMIAYVDNPNEPNAGGQLNIEAAVQSIFPTCKVVWSSTNTYDDNYAYIVQSPDNEFFLAVRGSLPFVVDGHTVIDWGIIANWLLEDFRVYTQSQWPYVSSGEAYVASGTMDAFNNISSATNYFGNTGQSALQYLQDNAVANNYPVYITGHSLGGNVANVYASYFAQQCPTADASVFSFAAPAAGNQDFVTDLQSKYPAGKAYHYEMNNDIIPRFPVVAAVESLENMFQPSPLATAISHLDVTLADLLQGVADTLKYDADIDLIDPYVSTAVTYAPYPLAAAWTDNTFDDWFAQASYQHTASHYASIFWQNTDAIVAALAPRITKAKAVYAPVPAAGNSTALA